MGDCKSTDCDAAHFALNKLNKLIAQTINLSELARTILVYILCQVRSQRAQVKRSGKLLAGPPIRVSVLATNNV